MIIEVIGGLAFAAMCGSLLFPEETEKLKRATARAAQLTKEQMSASAYTEKGRLIKGYRSQEEARNHRVRLDVGTVICLPNGTNITVEKGLKDVKSEDWWYAWMSI